MPGLTAALEVEMALDPTILKNWIEIQKRYDYPVNAIGMRINPADQKTMEVWRSEGLAAHLKQDGRNEE